MIFHLKCQLVCVWIRCSITSGNPLTTILRQVEAKIPKSRYESKIVQLETLLRVDKRRRPVCFVSKYEISDASTGLIEKVSGITYLCRLSTYCHSQFSVLYQIDPLNEETFIM